MKENSSCYIGGLLLRHLQSISCNAHEISELRLDKTAKRPMATSSAQGIGAGIYAVLSLFNHSCDPHVTRTFRGLECHVHALRGCARGTECTDSYGVLYAVNELAERQSHLREQYFFECTCAACAQNWPTYDRLPVSVLDRTRIKCSKCRLLESNKKERGEGGGDAECTNCIADLDNLKLLQFNSEQSLKAMLAFPKDIDLNNDDVMRKLDTGFGNYCAYIKALESFSVMRPFQDYNNNEEAIKQCLNLINLKYNKSF